jgi:hypothetical protein
VAVYLFLASGLLFAAFANAGYDDPFITYRYARNLANGQGFVYNPGERTLSTTTPLFTLLLALLASLPVDLPVMAILIGTISLALGSLFLWDMSRTWQTPAVGWAGLLLYPTFTRLVSTLGSETPLYMAFCLGAFASYARRRYNWAAAFCALAVLTRPDGILIPAVLAAGYLWERRRSLVANLRAALLGLPWRALTVFVGLLAPWVAFAWLYFGSPLPATLAAKQSQGTMGILQGFVEGFATILINHARFPHYWIEAALAVLGILWLFRRERPWALLLAWTVVYFTAYSVLGVSRYFWYYAPLVPGFIILIGLGLEAIRNLGLPSTALVEMQSAIRPVNLPILALLGLLVLGQASDLIRSSQHPDERLALYRMTGAWLRANTPPGSSLGTLEVGILGYYSERQMIDFAGLIQPQVASHLTGQPDFDNAAIWAVKTYQPDYLLLHRGYLPQLEAGYVARRCHLKISFISSSLVLDIYACGQPRPS